MIPRFLAFTFLISFSINCFPQQNPQSQADLADAVVSVSPDSYIRSIPGDFIGMSQDRNEIAAALASFSQDRAVP